MSAIWICGVDEAGRGPLVGSVVAGAVILDPDQPIMGLKDSKKLSPARRETLYAEIMLKAKAWGIGEASAQEIDQINILQATLLAMQRAVDGLHIQPDAVLIDGNKLPKLNIPAQAIVKGDSKIKAISAASILAKVARDKIMLDLAEQYPQFSFKQHKGYGTQQHLDEIARFGILDIHRKSFNPIRTLLLE